MNEATRWIRLLKLPDSALTKSDRRFLLRFLFQYSDTRVHKSLEALSKELGFSKATTGKAIIKLEALGYLDAQQPMIKKRGRPQRSLAVSNELKNKLHRLSPVHPLLIAATERLAFMSAKDVSPGESGKQRLDHYWVMSVLLANTDAAFWISLADDRNTLPCGLDFKQLALLTGLSPEAHYNYLKKLKKLRWITQERQRFTDPLLLGYQASLYRVNFVKWVQNTSLDGLPKHLPLEVFINHLFAPLESILSSQDSDLPQLLRNHLKSLRNSSFRKLWEMTFSQDLVSQLLNRDSLLLVLGRWSECLVLELLKHLDQKKLLELITLDKGDDKINLRLDLSRSIAYCKEKDPLGLRTFFERQHQVSGSLEQVEDSTKIVELHENLQDAANALASDKSFIKLARQCLKPPKRQQFATKESESQESQKQAQLSKEEASFDRELKNWQAGRKRIESIVLNRLGGRIHPLVNAYKAQQGRIAFEQSIFGQTYQAVVEQASYIIREIFKQLSVQHAQHNPQADLTEGALIHYLDSILAIRIDYSEGKGLIYFTQPHTDA